MRVVFLENEDSFSWNVVERLPVPRAAIRVVSGREAAGREAALDRRWLSDADVLVVGPGPTDPVRAGLVDIVREAAGRGLPVLGVCLGHQAIGLAFGAHLVRIHPTHGKRSRVAFGPSRLFPGVEGEQVVMRYHSLALADVGPPLRVVAQTADGVPMAVEHATLPVAGLQFHPDSYATPRGAAMIAAFFRGAGLLGGGAAPAVAAGSPRPATPGTGGVPLEEPLRTVTVRLDDLEVRPSFALLGPGYGGGRWLLLEDLRPSETAGRLVYASFEATSARHFDAAVVAVEGDPVPSAAEPSGVAVVIDETGFEDAVAEIRAAVEAGDVYQVCLTRHAHLEGATDGARLLSAICARGAPAYACWVRLPDGEEFVSGTPELFFEIRGRRIRSCPMKGTAPAGAAAALRASDKDHAELAMITDLVRNDLAAVCEPGTITVRRARRFVALPYAVQTVSDVAGRLRPRVGVDDALAALHPGGSVTGAPKRAALAVLRALEVGPRGAYCGALGYTSGDRTVISLLIRTAIRGADGWTFGVGGGIVHDSDPARELAELRTKVGAIGCVLPR